jgi:hypothetical protein
MKAYKRKGSIYARPYRVGENLTGVSVSDVDKRELETGTFRGMIAENPRNAEDKWLIALPFFLENYEEDR